MGVPLAVMSGVERRSAFGKQRLPFADQLKKPAFLDALNQMENGVF
jgi:hypothetical protein